MRTAPVMVAARNPRDRRRRCAGGCASVSPTPYRGFQRRRGVRRPPDRARARATIAQRLADAGVVPDPWTFRLAARLAHADRQLQAGEYRFAEPAIAGRRRRAPGARRRVHPRRHVSGRPHYPRDGADLRAQRPGHGRGFRARGGGRRARSRLRSRRRRTLEGYLFPSTYAMARTRGRRRTVKTMVAQFEHVFDTRCARRRPRST